MGHCVPKHEGCVWVRKDGETGLLSFVWREIWRKTERGEKSEDEVKEIEGKGVRMYLFA